MQTRRSALLTIAGAAASPLLLSSEISEQPIFFKPPAYALVTRLADLILPRTDTPGAVDAHVPYRIDHEVHSSVELQRVFEQGLALLPGDFLSLSESQQIEALHSISDSPFFLTMKGLTVDWYYRSEAGLVQELGFHGNTFRREFPGCTHPEHWPATAEETK